MIWFGLSIDRSVLVVWFCPLIVSVGLSVGLSVAFCLLIVSPGLSVGFVRWICTLDLYVYPHKVRVGVLSGSSAALDNSQVRPDVDELNDLLVWLVCRLIGRFGGLDWFCRLFFLVGFVRWMCLLVLYVGFVCWFGTLVVSVECICWSCTLVL